MIYTTRDVNDVNDVALFASAAIGGGKIRQNSAGKRQVFAGVGKIIPTGGVRFVKGASQMLRLSSDLRRRDFSAGY